jgi:single-stranded DNA-binding protein
MSAFNRVILVGVLKEAVKVRPEKDGRKTARLMLLVRDRKWDRERDEVVQADVPVDVEIAQEQNGRRVDAMRGVLLPGCRVLVEGKLQLARWRDARGVAHSRLYVEAREWLLQAPPPEPALPGPAADPHKAADDHVAAQEGWGPPLSEEQCPL